MIKQSSDLISIGYEGRTSEELLNILVELGVSTLVDEDQQNDADSEGPAK